MTLGNLLAPTETSPAQIANRYAEYSPPTHEQTLYYPYYESAPPTHVHVATSKHHYHGGGSHKNNAAMSALTLLAFLFFLHILQQCLRDHMTSLSTPQVMIVASGKEGVEKIDKSGVAETNKKHDASTTDDQRERDKISHEREDGLISPISENDNKYLTKITNNYGLKNDVNKYKKLINRYDYQKSRL